MGYTTIAIIYNPHSTRGGESLARETAARIRARLPKQKVELFQTEYAGHGEELAYRVAAASKRALIISSSGDGGYHDVINGAMRAQHEGFQVTTGLLPAGNANDHYHNLHTTDIVDQIAHGKPRQIDLLRLLGTSHGEPIERYAHSYIGFGLTPIVGSQLNKTKLDPIKEVWVVARALAGARPVRLHVGHRPRYYASIVISNIDVMAKYLRISRPSSVTDGKFEVTVFKRRGKLHLIMMLIKASLKGVEEERQVSRYTLRTVNKTLVQADGEIITLDADTDASITIEQQVLHCIV